MFLVVVDCFRYFLLIVFFFFLRCSFFKNLLAGFCSLFDRASGPKGKIFHRFLVLCLRPSIPHLFF